MRMTFRLATTLFLAAGLLDCKAGAISNNDGDSDGNGDEPVTRVCDSSITTSTVQFTTATVGVDEDAGSVGLAVSRLGGCTGVLTVSFSVSGGTATGSDYSGGSGTLQWVDQDSTDKIITVIVVDDSAIEGDETVEIELSIGSGDATLGSPATVTLTILDDDIDGSPPFRVADIRTVGTEGSYPGGVPSGIPPAVLGGEYFFSANDGVTGAELWKSDGTAAGTVQVADIYAGAYDSSPWELVATDTKLFFVAIVDETDEPLLHMYDPSTQGVVRVKPSLTGAWSRSLTPVGSQLFFVAYGDLWVSDGTDAGTVEVQDFFSAGPSDLTVMGSDLYFAASGELWTSDGTPSGTTQVIDLVAGGDSSPDNLVVMGGGLYFDADNGTGIGREIFKSDGTAGGTVLVGDVNSGTGSTVLANGYAVGNTLYFANDGGQGTELWKTDGTLGGTVMVKDIRAGGTSSNPHDFEAIGSTLYFVAAGPEGNALWKSDGTDPGTVLVKDTNPTSNSTFFGVQYLTAIGSTLFFAGQASTNDWELWKSDGTPAGTVIVKDRPNPSYPPDRLNPGKMLDLGGTLVFSADGGTHGFELWTSDGTTAGTNMLANINQIPLGSNLGSLTSIGSTLYFRADDGVVGDEIWQSDGTTGGTSLLVDLEPGVVGIGLYRLTRVGSELFFLKSSGSPPGAEVWKSDGTAGGTVYLNDAPTPGGTATTSNTLFFTSSTGSQLWKSDGTASGTVRIQNTAMTGPSGNHDLTTIGSTLYFAATDSLLGNELWKSDGTDAGTVVVKDIVSGSGDSRPDWLTSDGATLYFVAEDMSGAVGIWKSDGTDAGTTVVADLWTTSSSKTPEQLTVAGTTLYFFASGLSGGIGLWKSDGTLAGTTMLATLPVYNNHPNSLTAVGNNVFLVASNNDQNANALWVSDGTTAGTRVAKEILPANSGYTSPNRLTAAGNVLVFSVDDGVTGEELWRSDGTELGTYRVADINPGVLSSSPQGFYEMDGTVYFRATDTDAGPELWGYTP